MSNSPFPPLAFYQSIEAKINNSRLAPSAMLLIIRLYLAKFFFTAGLTKISNFDTTIALFADEYKVPIIAPNIAAMMATAAELSLPILLALGLLTRVASLGFFVMVAVIATFVYPGATENDYNFLLLGTVFVFGAGRFSLDAYVFGAKNP